MVGRKCCVRSDYIIAAALYFKDGIIKEEDGVKVSEY